MHIRWRGLELPSRVVRDEDISTKNYARFTIEPFEQGFGATIGNSLRRVLLSSLEGAAVTSVKIDGVAHEFTSIDGVYQDVTDIILNIKGIALDLDADEPRTMTVERNTIGEVRASDIEADAAIMVVNPDHLIATLTEDVPFRMEMTVSKGRGYKTGNDNRKADAEVGVIPLDSVFSPVLRVRYRTEDMRVGQQTNFDLLILEIWTDGTVTPEDALVDAGLILRKHLNPFVSYFDIGEDTVTPVQRPSEIAEQSDEAMQVLLDKPVSALNLSVRAANCLEADKTTTLRQLVAMTEADLLRVRSFGKTSLHEVVRKLSEVGLSLEMNLDEDATLDEVADEEDAPADLPPADSATADLPPADSDPATPPMNDPSVPAQAGPMEAFTMGERKSETAS